MNLIRFMCGCQCSITANTLIITVPATTMIMQYFSVLNRHYVDLMFALFSLLQSRRRRLVYFLRFVLFILGFSRLLFSLRNHPDGLALILAERYITPWLASRQLGWVCVRNGAAILNNAMVENLSVHGLIHFHGLQPLLGGKSWMGHEPPEWVFQVEQLSSNEALNRWTVFVVVTLVSE